MRTPVASTAEHRQELVLGAALALVLVTIWAQLPGAPLVERDETRYAEIAREMLVSGDYTVPHLNGVAWYEKPPLLFWAGAVSMRVFGPTPWAARLPARLAGVGTISVLLLWISAQGGRRRALLAALVAAGTPLGWGIAHLNLTDGLLTFFVTSAIVAGHVAGRQASASARAAVGAVAGVASGCAFLAKGLIGLVFPAAILGIWALSVRRGRQYATVAAASFVAALCVMLPWLVVVARHSPEYLRVLFVSEHFQRFATAVHHRQKPLFFPLAVFAVALTPVLSAFCRALFRRRVPPSEGERLALVWFAFVPLFFLFSKSQLASYVAPAIPAAGAFLALRFADSPPRLGAWVVQGALTSALALGLLVYPKTAEVLLEPGLRGIAVVGCTTLLGTTWAAAYLARKDEWTAVAVTLGGCAAVYAAVVVGWPRCAAAREMAALHCAIERARAASDAEVVTYRTFLRGLPWLLQRAVPFVDAGGELAAGLEPGSGPRSPLAWTEAQFWQRWKGEREVVALVNEGDISLFEQRAGGVPFIFGRARRHLLVAKQPPPWYPETDPRTSTALYASQLAGDSTPVPLRSVPAHVLASARRQLENPVFVHSAIEQTDRGEVYELVTGGPIPRLVEVDLQGRAVYTEELVDERRLPQPVLTELRRLEPRGQVLFVKRERPCDGGLDRFEILVEERGALREVEVDAAGRACPNGRNGRLTPCASTAASRPVAGGRRRTACTRYAGRAGREG